MSNFDEAHTKYLYEGLNIPDYCKKYADYITVRESVGGQPKTMKLSELPGPLYDWWVKWWTEKNIYPHRVRVDEKTGKRVRS